jgi:MFS family permease
MKTDSASTPSGASAPGAAAIRSITRRYWTIWAFYSFGPSFIFAIYPLFLRSRGLDQFHVNLVAAWYLVVMFLTDVPTGAFADVVGRRASVVIGCMFHVAGLYLYFVSHHYLHFILAETLEGFGDTFGNGPIDTWALTCLTRRDSAAPRMRFFRASVRS